MPYMVNIAHVDNFNPLVSKTLLFPRYRWFQASRRELTDALSSHYGSPGRLANYRREFDKTVRKMGEDPSNFAIKLETLAVKEFGNMGQIARLRLIRDRFIAGHESCDLRRYLDCVPPDTPLRDIVDRCRVWESHGTSEMRRTSKLIPEPVYPTYVVEQPDYGSEPVCMVSVNKQNSQVDQTDELLRKLLEVITPVTPPPIGVPKANPLDKLTELLMSQMVKSEPAPPPPVEPTGVELLLQNDFARQQSTGLGPRARQMRRNWADVQCFSCGKPGHRATRCPTLDVTFPFILPGWKAEKTPTGYLMISPRTAIDRRRAENENWSGGRGLPLGSVIRTYPMIPVEVWGSLGAPHLKTTWIGTCPRTRIGTGIINRHRPQSGGPRWPNRPLIGKHREKWRPRQKSVGNWVIWRNRAFIREVQWRPRGL